MILQILLWYQIAIFAKIINTFTLIKDTKFASSVFKVFSINLQLRTPVHLQRNKYMFILLDKIGISPFFQRFSSWFKPW